jgi:anti-sigma factor RsiW
MQCERARELVSAYVDGELPAGDRRAVETHMTDCRSCAALASDFRQVGQSLSATGREPLPPALETRVRASLAQARAADVHSPVPARAPRLGPILARPRSPLRAAAALVAVCVLSALATWFTVSRSDEATLQARDVLAGHVRALLQDSPITVAASDIHVVKPWFAGRLEFSPEVKDLAAEGFPLVGGRLDYIDGRRVAAIVYKRRLHVISVFIWPAAKADAAPRYATRNGYNLATWDRQGFSYWAVSDVSAAELAQLVGLL